MSFFEDWNKTDLAQTRYQASLYFLETGQLDAVIGGKRCTSSGSCGTGYACVQGECKKIEGPGGGTGGYYPPSYIPGGGGIVAGGDCGSGPDGSGDRGTQGCATASGGNGGGVIGCTIPTCGDPGGGLGYGGSDSDCCGLRTCRYTISNSGLNISCWCGDGGTTVLGNSCNDFCDEYYQTNGEDSRGCQEGSRCDECSTCSDNTCVKKECPDESTSCHCCPKKLARCEYCNQDGSVSTGVADCQFCCTRTKECCDGEVVASRVCGRRIIQELCELAQNNVDAKCKKICPDVAKCEKGCEGKTVCNPGPCPTEPPTADDGKVITVTGCIEAAGEHCLLYSDCAADEEDLKCCPPVECNCHSECLSGQNCSVDTGTCFTPEP